MLPILLLLAAADRADVELVARVAEDLETVEMRARYRYLPSSARDAITIVLPADRYRIMRELGPSEEREHFPKIFDDGGFTGVSIAIQGARCVPAERVLEDGARLLSCPGRFAAGEPIEVEIEATLETPERYGPMGRIGRQLTLGGGWFPVIAREGEAPAKGRRKLTLTIPTSMGAVIGRRYFPPIPTYGARTLERSEEDAFSLPLVVLPEFVTSRSIGGGRIVFVRKPPATDPERRRAKEVEGALADALRFLAEERRALPEPEEPLVVVEAPLRHDLAHATEGPVLLSDRAFRVFPVDRFYAFHRYPILREVFTALLLRRRFAEPEHVTADAAGAWLLDRYVASRVGRAEDVFDVLSLWSFIPAVDSMLYAPQLPFVGAYFRLIKEEDPERPNLIDFPDPKPRGKVIYEKLLDRLGRAETDRLFEEVLVSSLAPPIEKRLGSETEEFLATWLGPYPAVQYLLGPFSSRSCGERCWQAEITVERTGAAIAEPVQLLLEDDDGEERVIVAPATKAPKRTVTATLAAPLDQVTLDPQGRLAEAPSEDVPSPKLDNVSSPSWRVLLNNFNVLLAASAGQFDTAIDLGFSRVRDVHWSFAVNAGVNPAAVSLSGRATRYFGSPITPDNLSQWIGLTVAGDYLRSDFTDVAESGFALSGTLYYGYDNRRTVWAPEAGTGVRLAVDYSHVFGDSGDPLATDDALSVTARFLQSFRIAYAHQISLRASVGAYLYGRPREQLLYSLGGRRNVRGYDVGESQGRMRGIASAEWVHPLVSNENADFLEIAWLTGIDGALFADAAVIGDDLSDVTDGPVLADVGYGLRFTIDYVGARPGIMAIDLAIPLVDLDGRVSIGAPAIYIDFAQSFLLF